MNVCYHEILAAMGEPKWWDEHAVPRYVDFAPREVANIYAREAALVLITCQSCERPFKVAFSRSQFETLDTARALASYVRSGDLHYGDPPNAHCCPGGPTMNSVPRRVLEFWGLETGEWKWNRDAELEVDLDPEWAHD